MRLKLIKAAGFALASLFTAAVIVPFTGLFDEDAIPPPEPVTLPAALSHRVPLPQQVPDLALKSMPQQGVARSDPTGRPQPPDVTAQPRRQAKKQPQSQSKSRKDGVEAAPGPRYVPAALHAAIAGAIAGDAGGRSALQAFMDRGGGDPADLLDRAVAVLDGLAESGAVKDPAAMENATQRVAEAFEKATMSGYYLPVYQDSNFALPAGMLGFDLGPGGKRPYPGTTRVGPASDYVTGEGIRSFEDGRGSLLADGLVSVAGFKAEVDPEEYTVYLLTTGAAYGEQEGAPIGDALKANGEDVRVTRLPEALQTVELHLTAKGVERVTRRFKPAEDTGSTDPIGMVSYPQTTPSEPDAWALAVPADVAIDVLTLDFASEVQVVITDIIVEPSDFKDLEDLLSQEIANLLSETAPGGSIGVSGGRFAAASDTSPGTTGGGPPSSGGGGNPPSPGGTGGGIVGGGGSGDNDDESGDSDDSNGDSGGSDGSTGGTDDGTGGPDDGTGGTDDGTGGPDDGTGGPDDGTGGPDDGTGGTDDGTGGPDDGTGGPDDGTGGPDDGTGGPDDGTGGTDDGTGGSTGDTDGTDGSDGETGQSDGDTSGSDGDSGGSGDDDGSDSDTGGSDGDTGGSGDDDGSDGDTGGSDGDTGGSDGDTGGSDGDSGSDGDTGGSGDDDGSDSDTGASDGDTGGSDGDIGGSDGDTGGSDGDTGGSDGDTGGSDGDTGSDGDAGGSDGDTGGTGDDDDSDGDNNKMPMELSADAGPDWTLYLGEDPQCSDTICNVILDGTRSVITPTDLVPSIDWILPEGKTISGTLKTSYAFGPGDNQKVTLTLATDWEGTPIESRDSLLVSIKRRIRDWTRIDEPATWGILALGILVILVLRFRRGSG